MRVRYTSVCRVLNIMVVLVAGTTLRDISDMLSCCVLREIIVKKIAGTTLRDIPRILLVE